jgi:hypothetical protein
VRIACEMRPNQSFASARGASVPRSRSVLSDARDSAMRPVDEGALQARRQHLLAILRSEVEALAYRIGDVGHHASDLTITDQLEDR